MGWIIEKAVIGQKGGVFFHLMRSITTFMRCSTPVRGRRGFFGLYRYFVFFPACSFPFSSRSITPDRSPDRQSGLPLRQSVTPDMRMFLRIVIPAELVPDPDRGAGIHIIIINRTRDDIPRGSPGQAQCSPIKACPRPDRGPGTGSVR